MSDNRKYKGWYEHGTSMVRGWCEEDNERISRKMISMDAHTT
jgi:hypothetical protein